MLFTYRQKITFIALLITLLIQIICILSGIQNFNRYSNQMAKLNYDRCFQAINQSLSIKFNSISALFIKLQNEIFRDFVSGYYALKDPAKASEVQEKTLHELNNLSINPSLVSKIYMISGNSNQMSFAKNTSDNYFSKEVIPHVDLMQSTGLLTLLSTNYTPFLFSYDDFQTKLGHASHKLKAEEQDSLKELALNLKDRTLICVRMGVGDPGSIIILVLGKGFESKELLNDNENEINYPLTLLDREYNIIFSNFSDKANISKEFRMRINSEGNGSWYSTQNGIKWMHRCTIIPQFSMYMNLSMQIYPVGQHYLIFRSIWYIVIIFLVISPLAAYYLTGWITLPLNELGTWMRGNGYKLPVVQMNPDKVYLNKIPKLKTTKKLMVIFLLSVILPNFFSCILYSTIMYTRMEKIAQERISNNTRIIQSNIISLLDTCSFVSQLMASDVSEQLLATYVHPIQERDLSLLSDAFVKQANYYFNQEFATSYFSYFAITDSNYRILYSSTFPSNPDAPYNDSTLMPAESIIQKKDSSIIYFPVDLLNRPSVAIINNITRQDENANSNQIGYFMLFLQPDIFEMIISDLNIEYVILDPERHVAFRSNKNEGFSEAAVKFSNDNQLSRSVTKNSQFTSYDSINGIKYMLMSQAIEETGSWEVIVFERIYDIYFNNWYTLGLYFIIILIVFIMCIPMILFLSRIICKPLNIMIESISQLGSESGNEPVNYHNDDEAGQLVSAYNEMAFRIKRLIQENTDIRLQQQELVTLKSRAELNMLQQQINPHFLYNALEVINYHSKQKGDEISSKMATALANLFRYNTSTAKNTVPLEQELFHVRNYLIIQELRFKDKFTTAYDIDTDTLSIKVMRLILQPILENCINHGIYEYTKGGRINVTSRISDGMVELDVSDNGIGMKPSQLAQLRQSLLSNHSDEERIALEGISHIKGNGIGLKNVYKRILLFYGDQATFQIESVFMQGTTVKLRLPILP